MAAKGSTKVPSERDYVLKISLRGAEPPVWRRVRVPGEITLEWLHVVIQGAMGWENCHLHSFKLGKARYGNVEGMQSGQTVVLQKLITRAKTKLHYTYDFGDGWEHEIVVEKIEPAAEGAGDPELLDGAGACPPEDSGGIYNYGCLQQRAADANDPEHEDALEFLGDDYDPQAFSLADARERLAAYLLDEPIDDDFGDEDDDEQFDDLVMDGTDDLTTEDRQTLLDIMGSVSGEEAEEFVKLMDQGAWMLTCNRFEDIRVKGEGDADFTVPAVGFCLTMRGGIPNLVEHHAADSAGLEEPLVVVLVNKALGTTRGLPGAVFVANDQAKADLERSGFGERVRIIVSPIVDHMGRVLANDFLEHAGDGTPPLEMFAPVKGQAGIGPDLQVRYFTAAHDFYEARPWRGLANDLAFCLTLPGGEEKHAIVMGQGLMEIGILVFSSEQDCSAYWSMSQTFPSDPNAMPALLSLTYDEADTCSDELAELATDCFGPWARADRLPLAIKTVVKGGFEQLTAADFEMLALAAASFAECRNAAPKSRKNWCPRAGELGAFRVSLAGLKPCTVKVRVYCL